MHNKRFATYTTPHRDIPVRDIRLRDRRGHTSAEFITSQQHATWNARGMYCVGTHSLVMGRSVSSGSVPA